LATGEIELLGEQVNFKWFKREGKATIDLVTTDIAEALKGVGLIIIAIPAKGHQAFFEKMIPHLSDGQIISIFPDNFGTLRLKAMMDLMKSNADVLIGGWTSMPYGVRMVEPGKVNCIIRIREIMGDTLPSEDGDRFIALLKKIPSFDGTLEVKKGDTILGVDLSNPNPLVHVPGSILNVGAMEVSEMERTLGIPKGQYSMYKYGMSPSVARVQQAFYQEERKIADALGIQMIEYKEEQFFWKAGVMGIEYCVPFGDVIIPPIVGPNSVHHRYFTEDIPVGTVVRYHLAKKFGVDIPIIESMIKVGSVVCNRDFLKDGLSLEELGIHDLNKKELLEYIKRGKEE